jgi:hypothetical protein
LGLFNQFDEAAEEEWRRSSMPELMAFEQTLGEVACGRQLHAFLGNGFNTTRFSRKHE